MSLTSPSYGTVCTKQWKCVKYRPKPYTLIHGLDLNLPNLIATMCFNQWMTKLSFIKLSFASQLLKPLWMVHILPYQIQPPRCVFRIWWFRFDLLIHCLDSMAWTHTFHPMFSSLKGIWVDFAYVVTLCPLNNYVMRGINKIKKKKITCAIGY